MSKIELINAFVDELLLNPNHVVEAVRLRLFATDYELVLKKADPLKPYEKQWDSARKAEEHSFPMATAGKEVY